MLPVNTRQVFDLPRTLPHRIRASEDDWIDLPDLGDLSSDRQLQTLKREIRLSAVMRAEVAVSALRQLLLRMGDTHGQTLPADEVLRIVGVVASAL